MLLQINNLKKYFGGLKAVDDVSFDIARGEIVSLIGPNGAGKTTLFNCLTGILKPTAGRVFFHGMPPSPSILKENNKVSEPLDITGFKPDKIAKSGISRTFQNIRLFSNLSVVDNVKIGRHVRTKTHFLGAVFLSKPYIQLEEQT